MICWPTIAMPKFVAAVSGNGVEAIDRQNDVASSRAIRHGDVASAAIEWAYADGSAELADFLQRQQLFDHRAVTIRVIVSFGWNCDLHWSTLVKRELGWARVAPFAFNRGAELLD
jgi:hypothetical protein